MALRLHNEVGREAFPPAISVVMPCFNEAENIEAAIDNVCHGLFEKGLRGELIIVNDGSSDSSFNVIQRKTAVTGIEITVINKSENQGIGRAFWDGAEKARYDFIVMIPGDGENDFFEVLSYFSLLEHVDIVIPYIHNAEARDLRRRIISSVYRLVVNMSFGTSLNYTNGTVIYNKKALRTVELRATGFFYQAELLVKLTRKGFLYAEVPHFVSKRGSGKSTALTVRSLGRLASSFLLLVFDIHIRRVESKRTKIGALPFGTVTERKYRDHHTSCGN
jgi:dolichol-phosphate mannosyltransferase